MNDSIEDIRRELGTDRKRRKHAPPEAEFICEGCYKPIIGRVNRTADDVSLCDACADECIAAGSVEAPEPPAPEAESGSQDVVCPFCGEGDFDLPGLKLHYLNNYCEAFTETIIPPPLKR